MGEHIEAATFTSADRQRYREKVRQCLAALATMLAEDRFEAERKLMGLELELNLVDDHGEARMNNEDVLAVIESADFQTEVGQFNIEANLAPAKLSGRVFREVEEEVRTSLNHADRKARETGARVIMIGILPTLRDTHTTLDQMTPNPRYALLNEQILAARGEDLTVRIDGVERLDMTSRSIVPEGAATSMQLHLQVSAAGFAPTWNAAQALAPVQVALGANSPYLFGKELWRETRIPLFTQITDTRSEEYAAQGVRPRVWFGERWITSVMDLFEENARYFPALLPLVEDEDPQAMLAKGEVPHLPELRLHNGTIYRWNRPVYDVARGKPHLRVENRVLPAGPTVADVVANAAFYYGLLRVMSEWTEPVDRLMSFSAAAENLNTAAKYGIDAHLYHPGVGVVPVSELVLRHLLPAAAEGLDRWEVDPVDRDRYLGIIEGRCLTRRNGASWQAAMVHHLEDRRGMARDEALSTMLAIYAQHMHSNDPVHTWEWPA